MKFQTVILAMSAMLGASSARVCKPKSSSLPSAATSSAPTAAAVATSTSSVVAEPTSTTPSAAVVAATSSTPIDSTTAAAAVATSSPSSSVAAVSTSTAPAAVAVASTSSAAPSSASSSSSSSTSGSSSASVSGESTFYGGNLSGGACSFTTMSSLPSGLYGTAYSGAVWDNAAECGTCLKVTGPNGNSVTVMVVDECPECAEGHLDLFEDAFLQLGTASEGIISTSYTVVPCGITSPIVLHSKTGTSEYWFSMQVFNSNEGVSKLEVSSDSGSTWTSATRTEYNFFEISSGTGTDTVEVRVTSTSGGTITVSNVSVASDAKTTASSNFS